MLLFTNPTDAERIVEWRRESHFRKVNIGGMAHRHVR